MNSIGHADTIKGYRGKVVAAIGNACTVCAKACSVLKRPSGHVVYAHDRRKKAEDIHKMANGW